MAAVLAQFLPERFMGQQVESRAASAGVKAATRASAPAKQPRVVVSAGSESEGEDAEGSPDEGEVDAGQDENIHDEYTDDDEDGEEQARPPKAASMRKTNNRRNSQKNARIKVQDSTSDQSTQSSEAESSEAEAQWEATSDAAEEDEDPETVNCCIFCGDKDYDDPSDEYEEPLACALCGDIAHRQCARDAKSFSSDKGDASEWRCPSCIENGVEPDVEDVATRGLRQTSAPKFARDLLPASRGAPKPGSHSVFNKLILDDDPMDGSRSLRKRKSTDEVEERPQLEPKKRQRRSASDMNAAAGRMSVDEIMKEEDEEEDMIAVIDAPVLPSPRSRPSRVRASKRMERPLVSRVEPISEDNLTLAFHLGSAKLAGLENDRRKRKRKEREHNRRANRTQEDMPAPEVFHYPPLQASSFAFQNVSFGDQDGETTKVKPYGGILSEAEADTSKTFPQSIDRKKFEDARLKAEEQWRKKIAAVTTTEPGRPSAKSSGPPSKIKCVNFGGFEIDTWHNSLYPEEYSRNRVLYICEFCLKYMSSDFVAWRHKLKCPAKHPPGDEIYRDGPFSFFEVDGRKNPVYCQNLCLLAKLFLGSKTLYFDVEPFLFYIMTENDEFGCHFVGYFSKEKRPSSLNNVSCILVLPIHQRRGFGNLLIEVSYLLTRVEQKTGSPEKPLSDMGLVTYRTYWRLVMCYHLVDQKTPLSIAELSDRTGMTADDIVCALEGLRALVRDPVTKTYALRLDHEYFRKFIENYEQKGYVKLNSDALVWVPYVMGRDNMHYENAAPLHTVAQRDEDTGAIPEEGVQQALAAESQTDGDDQTSKGNTSSYQRTPAGASPDPQDDVDRQLQEESTPFTQMDMPQPVKMTPTTPFAEAQDGSGSAVPATRFEIFPPLPGTAARRRPGRPPGRSTNRRGTPVRRNLSYDHSPSESVQIPTTMKRTRSKLAETIIGDDDDDELDQPSPGPASKTDEGGRDDDELMEDADA